jgi:hypothetical protein
VRARHCACCVCVRARVPLRCDVYDAQFVLPAVSCRPGSTSYSYEAFAPSVAESQKGSEALFGAAATLRSVTESEVDAASAADVAESKRATERATEEAIQQLKAGGSGGEMTPEIAALALSAYVAESSMRRRLTKQASKLLLPAPLPSA